MLTHPFSNGSTSRPAHGCRGIVQAFRLSIPSACLSVLI